MTEYKERTQNSHRFLGYLSDLSIYLSLNTTVCCPLNYSLYLPELQEQCIYINYTNEKFKPLKQFHFGENMIRIWKKKFIFCSNTHLGSALCKPADFLQ